MNSVVIACAIGIVAICISAILQVPRLIRYRCINKNANRDGPLGVGLHQHKLIRETFKREIMEEISEEIEAYRGKRLCEIQTQLSSVGDELMKATFRLRQIENEVGAKEVERDTILRDIDALSHRRAELEDHSNHCDSSTGKSTETTSTPNIPLELLLECSYAYLDGVRTERREWCAAPSDLPSFVPKRRMPQQKYNSIMAQAAEILGALDERRMWLYQGTCRRRVLESKALPYDMVCLERTEEFCEYRVPELWETPEDWNSNQCSPPKFRHLSDSIAASKIRASAHRIGGIEHLPTYKS